MLFSTRLSLAPLSRIPLIALLCLVLQAPTEASTPDFNNDGQVNFLDFVLLAQRFGTHQNDASYNTIYDLDNNGDIGFGDFVRFVQQFGATIEPALTHQHSLDPSSDEVITIENGPEVRIPSNALSGPGTLRFDPIELDADREPQDATRVSPVFDITLEGATLTSPVEITMPYDPLSIPAGATMNDLYIAWWDGENWHPIPSTVNPPLLRAQIDHFSLWTGVFSRIPTVQVFTSIPDALELKSGSPQTLNLNLTVDPANISFTDLRVRLTLALSDGISNAAVGRFTLSDNGRTDPSPPPTVGLTVRSNDTTEPLDGHYGAEITLDPDPLPERFSELKASITITTRRIASIAIDTTISIPITRIRPTRFAISGRLSKGEEGVANAIVVLAGTELQIATSDANGDYTFKNLEKGVYVISPTKPNHSFTPANLTIALEDTDITGVNFTDVSGGPTFAAGDALELGGNAYLAVDIASGSPLDINTGAFTAEAWIRPIDTTSRTIIGRWQGSDTVPAGQWLLGTQEASINSSTPFISRVPSRIQSDAWVHYALVVQSNKMAVYINGAAILETATELSDLYTGTFPNDQLIIGGFKNGTGTNPAPFKGLIDEVRIWNRALDSKTIRENMHYSLATGSALTRPETRSKQALNSGLVGHWNFNTQNASGQVPDLSGFGNHGLLINTASRVLSDAPLAARTGNPVLQIQPSELSVTAEPHQATIELINLSSGQLVWTVSENAAWLRVTSPLDNTDGDGAFYGEGEQNLTIHTTGAGLPGGTYQAAIHIWSTGGLLEFPIVLDNGPGTGNPVPNEDPSGIDIVTLTTPAGTTHEMVLVPAGEFIMGSTNGNTNATPPHAIVLNAFHIDRFEVTNAHYTAFATTTGRRSATYAKDGRYNETSQPVVGVSYADALAYCAWIEGQLPTEAQWEKAARGIDGRTYPWGETEPDDSRLNHNRTVGKSVPVGSYPAGVSPYGIHDMAGNVWEWTNDWYNNSYYTSSPTENPPGPANGTVRVVRGGSWGEKSDFARTFHRFWLNPAFTNELLGFRCVASP